MFVRWQKRKRRTPKYWGRGIRNDTHYAAILVESVRIDGRPRQRHVAYLDGITDSAIKIKARRAYFWQKIAETLDRLKCS